MPRIAGVDVPLERPALIGLTAIFGIGRSTSARLLDQAGVDPQTRVRDLSDDEVVRLRELIDRDVITEGDLRREVRQNIQRLIEISCYRGIRHRRNLPVHGQRTRTNARTRRGVRKTVGGRKRVARQK
ncbi:MAG: 30S ribosomal protein S13 [Dehalococcoidia bacterium]|nr:30S ribosomal protein S13 [Dehalococcoidia bacterium]